MTETALEAQDAALLRAFAKVAEQKRKVDGMAESDPWRPTEIAILFAMRATALNLHAAYIEKHGVSADPGSSTAQPIRFQDYAKIGQD